MKHCDSIEIPDLQIIFSRRKATCLFRTNPNKNPIVNIYILDIYIAVKLNAKMTFPTKICSKQKRTTTANTFLKSK